MTAQIAGEVEVPETGEATIRRAGTAPLAGIAAGIGTAEPEGTASAQGAAPTEGSMRLESMPHGESTQRAQLSRERIVGSAVKLIEREGEDALSMRRIAAELGYGVMSLYNHVPNKAALLDAIAEYVMADLQFAADAQADWGEQARALVRTFREISRKYPRSVNVVIMRQLNSTAGLRPLELALATARAAGFDGVTAVRVMRTFVAYALGTLVSDARLDLMRANAAAGPGGYAARLDPAEFPNALALASPLTEHDHEADFEFGLDLLITAVAALPRADAPDMDAVSAEKVLTPPHTG
jgi:AcrR family transcriptional regulator